MASALCMTPAQVRDSFTMDDVLDMHDYWHDHPPVQWMVQNYLGFKPSPSDPPSTAVPDGAIPQVPFKP